MKSRNKMKCACVLVAFLPAVTLAEGSSFFDGGWRVSAGAVYDSGVKTDMRYTPQQTYVSPYTPTPGAMTKAKAREAAWGRSSGTRTTYVNSSKGNAVSYADSADISAGQEVDHDPGKTMNYRFPAEVWDENTAFELGYAEYEEISVVQGSAESMQSHSSDDAAMPGVNVQISRNLYHDDEHGWGVEVAFGVQYARRNDVVKSSSNWMIGKSSKSTGHYSSRYEATGDLAELLTYSGEGADFVHDYVWSNDGVNEYLGANGNTGFATPIDLDDIKNEWGGGTETSAEYGSMEAKGDYENLELMLLLQPYYDICSWLSINATLGMVVSRQSMEMNFAMFRNGRADYRSNRDFSQWDVYGIAGLGMMVYYKDFTLSGDFLARVFDRDMDIKDTYYKGTVSRGDWMFRLALGYEF